MLQARAGHVYKQGNRPQDGKLRNGQSSKRTHPPLAWISPEPSTLSAMISTEPPLPPPPPAYGR